MINSVVEHPALALWEGSDEVVWNFQAWSGLFLKYNVHEKRHAWWEQTPGSVKYAKEQFAKEARLVQEVYAAVQKYGKFLEHGVPFTFDIPEKPGTVISGLELNDSILIRRTDFDENRGPVQVLVGTKRISVKSVPGVCHVVALN